MDPARPTEIIFDGGGWRGLIARDFTFGKVRLAAQAVAEYLKSELADANSPIHGLPARVIIAHDARFLGPQFALAAAEILTGSGLSPLVCQEAVSAAVLVSAIRERGAIGGILIGAIVKAPEYSGFKFFRHTGSGATAEICRRLEGSVARLQKENWSFPAVVTGTFPAKTIDLKRHGPRRRKRVRPVRG